MNHLQAGKTVLDVIRSSPSLNFMCIKSKDVIIIYDPIGSMKRYVRHTWEKIQVEKFWERVGKESRKREGKKISEEIFKKWEEIESNGRG